MSRYDVNDEPIAGYRLVEFLGEGNFGTVWKAVEVESEIYVALKVIDLSRSPSALKELKGLNLVRNLRHPNLIPIYTARIKDRDGHELPLSKADEMRRNDQLSELVIAMGLGDRSLSARLREHNPADADPAHYRGLPLDEVLGYMEGAAKGIDYLNRADHGLGKGTGDGPIVHCDIKPDNMMIVAGEVQIADCGVAVLVSPDARQTKASCSLAYSPPELSSNKPMPGSDQYSLAISYYELRTGQLPIDRGAGQLQVMLAHATGQLDFSHPALTPGERRVLKRATAVQPQGRYPSCWEMVKELAEAARSAPPVPAGHAAPPAVVHGLTGTTDAIAVEFDGLRATGIPDHVALSRTLTPADTKSAEATPLPADAALFRPTTTAPDLPPPPAEPPPKVSRPKVSVDANDPLGAHYGTVSLDAELQAIIRPPAAVVPPAATVPPPPRPTEPDEPSTRPSPGRLSSSATALSDAELPQAFVKLAPAPEPPRANSRRGTKWIAGGVAAGVLAAGGLLLPPLFTRPPAVVPPSPPVDRFAEALAALPAVPAERLHEQASSLLREFPAAEQQQSLVPVLFEIGRQHPDRREAIADALTEGDDFARRVPDESARAEVARWQLPQLDATHAGAVRAVQQLGTAQPPADESVTAAAEAVDKLQTAVDAFDVRFGTPEVVSASVRDFVAVGTAWAAARANPADLPPFEVAFKTAGPTLPPAFGLELLRLTAARTKPIDAVRTVRDRVLNGPALTADDKSRVRDVYDAALAVHVRDALSRPDPDWQQIQKACGDDPAHGWAKLAAAESRLTSGDTGVATLIDEAEKVPATATAADKKNFVTYLRAVGKPDAAAADALEQLYQTPAGPLKHPTRRTTAARVLGANGLAVRPRNPTTAELLSDNPNPYAKDARALAWLKRADELAGTAHPEWAVALALLADAGGDRKTVRAVTGRETVDDAKVADADLPLAIAYLFVQARDAEADDTRAAAAASYARLAYRVLEYAFATCPTQRDVYAVEAKLLPTVEAVVDRALPKAEADAPDHLALRLAKVRARVLLDPLTPDRQATLGRELDGILGRMIGSHPDKADAHAHRAYVTLQGFSAYPLDAARKPAGVLHDAPEPARQKAWVTISSDVASALRLDATNRLANTVAAYQTAAEFGTLPPYVAPKAARKTDFVVHGEKVQKAVAAFDAAAAKMPTRKLATFWAARGTFLLAAADDQARAGKTANVKAYLADAEKALKAANDQRADADPAWSDLDRQLLAKRYDELRLLGCVLDAKAWLTRDDPAVNYTRALQCLKLDRPPETDQEFEGTVDFARCVIHAVRSGVFPPDRLADADAALAGLGRATDAVRQNSAKPREVKAAVDRHAARGEYWQSVLFLHRFEASLDAGDKGRNDLLARVEAEAEKWDALFKKDAGLRATAAFLPEYLRGRAALKNNKAAAAADHFRKAYALLDAAAADGRLRLDDSFAVRSLVHELSSCYTFLSAADRQKRLALLADLHQRYDWVLTDKDRDAVRAVKKLK